MGKAEAKGLASPDPCVRDAAEPDQPWHSGSAACAGNQNRTLEIKIQRLEEELEGLAAREKKILGRVAAEMDTMQAEINRLRLSTQLNSNALDRILRQPEPESAEKENDSQES